MKNFAKIFGIVVFFAVIVFPATAGGSDEKNSGSAASGTGGGTSAVSSGGDKRAELSGEWGKEKDPEGYEWFAFEEDSDTVSFRSASMMGFAEDSLKLTSYDGSTLNAVYHVERWWEDGEFEVPFTFSVQRSGDKLTISGLKDDPDTLIYLSSYNGTYTKQEE